MLFASDDAPKREGYRYEQASSGGVIGWPADSQPYINRRHIDGPLLYMRNGQMHWLTPWERVLLWLGLTDALILERKYAPTLSLPVRFKCRRCGLTAATVTEAEDIEATCHGDPCGMGN